MEKYPNQGHEFPLLIKTLLDRPLRWAPDQEIVYRDANRISYREFGLRLNRFGHFLNDLGAKQGDVIGIIDWDSHRYLEAFFTVPMCGCVLHTINPRLAPQQLLYTINHAEDQILFVHADFLPLVEQFRSELKTVRKIVLLSDDSSEEFSPIITDGDYDNALMRYPDSFTFPDFDENTIATLFFTTGTTGKPKGVFFSHRQLVLHTITNAFNLAAHREPVSFDTNDVYMPLTPMFHVHAWGIPYIATLLGVKRVYPGRYEPKMILQLLSDEKVTFSHCVPTILQMILVNPVTQQTDLSGWQIVVGGSALSKGLARMAEERGIRVVVGYGMSETCPLVAISHHRSDIHEKDDDPKLDITISTGFPPPLVQARICDSEGNDLPLGKENVGELVLRAPWLTAGYFKSPEQSADLWDYGWMHTGDIAYIDKDGYIRLTDRLKDVIKIAGEWISSLELENTLSQHEAVADVAVVGKVHMKWGEIPCAFVVLKEGAEESCDKKTLARHLRTFVDSGIIHKRSILTEVEFMDQLPKTGVGKNDKKALRGEVLPD